MTIIWIVGLLDDKYNLPPLPMILGLLLAAGVAMYFKVFVELFNNPLNDEQIKLPWYLMIPVSLVWIVGMSGTVNFLDGLDGLASGVTAIAAGVLFIHMLRLQQYSVALLPLALIGCCLGFLLFNTAPARIFLGGGAYLLGFALATVSIVAGAKVASALLVLWVPIVDVMWQVYSRWRRDQPLGMGDRGHLHLRLQDMGWSQRRIVLLYYGITALLGAIALVSSSRLLKFGVLLGGALLVMLVLAVLARRSGDATATGR
jgi:UDP-GlcNAc:undecaprenyl-phosphate GlcNAc-1-phosphate transferase